MNMKKFLLLLLICSSCSAEDEKKPSGEWAMRCVKVHSGFDMNPVYRCEYKDDICYMTAGSYGASAIICKFK